MEQEENQEDEENMNQEKATMRKGRMNSRKHLLRPASALTSGPIRRSGMKKEKSEAKTAGGGGNIYI